MISIEFREPPSELPKLLPVKHHLCQTKKQPKWMKQKVSYQHHWWFWNSNGTMLIDILHILALLFVQTCLWAQPSENCKINKLFKQTITIPPGSSIQISGSSLMLLRHLLLHIFQHLWPETICGLRWTCLRRQFASLKPEEIIEPQQRAGLYPCPSWLELSVIEMLSMDPDLFSPSNWTLKHIRSS